MLNPETVVMRRTAGIRPRETLKGLVNANRSGDNPLLFTGSGSTILELDLLFDVTILGSSIETEDVRKLTKPIWDLSENNQRSDGLFRPAICRFIWGKSWNFPGVVSAIAERLEYFSPQGVPRRSWMRLRLLRMQSQLELPQYENEELGAIDQELNGYNENPILTDEGLLEAYLDQPDFINPEIEMQNNISTSRIDFSAYRLTGDPTRWRDIAITFNLLNPLQWIKSLSLDQYDSSGNEESENE
ncbi:MAG: hypothetical protein DU480_13670 [Nitrosomonas sp.]